jgi:uncharacterized OB-fold protein
VERVQPRHSDGLADPFFAGCREGVLRLQHCGACGGWQFYPRPFCVHCGADGPAWREASGRGRIASFTVVRRALSGAYEAPYVVALVDLAEGPRLMSHIVDCAPEAVSIDAPVRVHFQDWGPETVLPVFRIHKEEL